ncbi:flagellar motor protein MotA [Oleomonas cavernae]|uniref:Flagellar motor protein MotA n=1 Tax=Oleomonas cavernae TaxID=2320859 RepID=A0A418VU35_9PROT|nr:MotA/TolQ/ExbB proton channel family protein [Oleomonas cavernae]RJF80653.1 flagellar motor protein MotA [Oleomonas cavernae]
MEPTAPTTPGAAAATAIPPVPSTTPLDPAVTAATPLDPASAPDLAAQAHDLTISGLFLQADPVVKAVMVLLIVASIITWGIALEKALRLRRLRREVTRFEAAVAAREGAAAAARLDGLPRTAVDAGLVEWRELAGEETDERRNRAEQAMRLTSAEGLRGVEQGLPFLATVGSAAPFIGLFGTVWGILNSFTSIANSQDTSLAVVAPGIAEALFATAIGLVAAIPAVMFYNAFATQLGRVGQRLSTGIARLSSQLGRAKPAELRRAAE